jgi:50S ribosomal protein L16 3-hydroxylase
MTSPPIPDQALALLGGLTPETFMRRHWQKKPLLIRQALDHAADVLPRSELLALAAQEGVESRLIRQGAKGWSLRHGPFERRQLPAFKQPRWTLLVQGVDLHWPAAHRLLRQFRFVPDARLDDAMVSFATDGGGVGPHTDSYDVFLLQLQGRRRWRIGRQADPRLQGGVPLKILANFVPEQEWLLEPGDMLYLPPGWAHDGQAVGECMTCSIGFRSASQGEFAREVVQRCLDALQDEQEAPDAAPPPASQLYRDPKQAATLAPACIPAQMQAFAQAAAQRLLRDPSSLNCSLGEWLSEPKPGVWFEEGHALERRAGLELDARTRMLYDGKHLFINGESFHAAGRDARLLRRLADLRRLPSPDVAQLSGQAWVLVQDWAEAGWLRPLAQGEEAT